MTKPKAARKRGTDSEIRAALERVLSHAESHGEVYVGAIADHATIRAAMTDADETVPGGAPKATDVPAGTDAATPETAAATTE